MPLRTILFASLVCGVAVPAIAQEEAVRVVAVHPDRQLSALLDLFRGTRATSPPAALVDWKQATGRALSKPTEAAITLLHPWNIAEFQSLDGADLAVRFGDSTSWWLRIPNDDGAAAEIATALALTDGGRDEPFQGHPVDRLGPPGSAVMTTLVNGPTLAASGREMLGLAIEPGPGLDRAGIDSGFVAQVRPSAVQLAGSLRGRQALELICGLGASEVDLATGLDGGSWLAHCRTRLDKPVENPPVLDPSWLDDLPAEGVAAAGALAVDPRPDAWNTLFRAIDRAIHSDPEQVKAAPIRARLSTLTIPVGVALEAQVWPRIRGLAAALKSISATGEVDGLLVIVHATDPASADRLARQVLPKLAKVAGASRSAGPADDPTIAYVGKLRGRPLEVRLDGDRVAVGWGDGMLAAFIETLKSPERSAGAALKSLGIDLAEPCHHAAVAWPSRWPSGWAADEPATMAIESLGPVAWVGRVEGAAATDEFRIPGLSASVVKFLDRIPVAPDDQP